MDELAAFLSSQKILQIAPHAGDPWIANVLMGSHTPEKIYFVGSKKRLYAKQLLEDPRLAFATAWHEEGNHVNRKGIQGVGEARPAESDKDITIGVELHNSRYPEFKEDITVDWIRSNDSGAGVWVITPTFIKFWNDELYGRDGSKEFNFNTQ